MSYGDEGIDTVGLCETGQPRREVDDDERRAARARRALPCEQHGKRRRIELRECRAVDRRRAAADARETGLERGLRARVGQGAAGFERVDGRAHRRADEVVHDCLPFASCWLRAVRNWIRPSTPLFWICSLNCCWYAWISHAPSTFRSYTRQPCGVLYRR